VDTSRSASGSGCGMPGPRLGVWTTSVEVRHPFSKDPSKMGLVHRDQPIETHRRIVPISRSQNACWSGSGTPDCCLYRICGTCCGGEGCGVGRLMALSGWRSPGRWYDLRGSGPAQGLRFRSNHLSES
jgi:hypothetical protein